MNYKIKQGLKNSILFLSFLTTSIGITIFSYFVYYLDITHLNIPQLTGVSKEVLKKNYQVLMNYLNNPFVKTLQLPDFPSSPNGLSHFADVKKLFLLNHGLWLILLIPSILILREYLKRQDYFHLSRFFKGSSLIPVFFAFLMLLGFDTFFVSFHKVLFRNDNWIFDPSVDPVINALPESFFFHCFLYFFIFLEGFFVIGYFLSRHQETTLKN